MFSRNNLVFAVHFICTILLVKAIIFHFPNLSICYFKSFLEWITCLFVAVNTFQFTKKIYLNDEVSPEKKAVLITGCDTGFGHMLAKRLDSKGFAVFACCLFPSGEGAGKLQKTCSKRLKIVGLDVTKDESVTRAKEFVLNNLGASDLWAIVNNAGILKFLNCELSTLQDFQDSMEVNAIGPVRVTKAFLPLLRKSKGRVINVTSIAGRYSFPLMAPYFMSKHAAVAFNDVLRKEMKVWGVRVISIEPDFFATQLTNENIIDKSIDSSVSLLDGEIRSDYGENYFASLKKKKRHVLRFTSANTKMVIDALDSAITLQYPDIIYKPRGSLFTALVAKVFEVIPYNAQDGYFVLANFVIGYPKPKNA